MTEIFFLSPHDTSYTMKPKLTHKQKKDKLVDDLDYLTTAEIDALLTTTKAFKTRNEIKGAPTTELVTELERRKITTPKRS